MVRARLPSALPWLALMTSTSAAASAQTVKLNGPLAQPGAGDVLADYAFGPSGGRIVFRADVEEDGVFELYSAPSDASGAALRLAPGIGIQSFVIGNARVLIVADATGSGVVELLQVPILGGAAPSALSGSLVAGGDVQSVQLTPDRTRAVFLADKLVDGRSELFCVPVDASAPPVQIDPAPAAGDGNVARSWISPDGTTVLFARRQAGNFNERLFAAPLDGASPAIELASIPLTLGAGEVYELAFTADGQHAVFEALEWFDGEVYTAYLFSVPVDGSDTRRTLDVSSFFYHRFAVGAGGRVVFHAENDGLFSSAVDGTQRVQLQPASWTPDAFALTSDGATVVFGARTTTQGGLFRIPITGSEPPTTLVTGGSFAVQDIEIGASDRIAYLAANLYSVPLDGSQLPLTLASSTVLNGIELAAGGSEVVYRSARGAGLIELFAVPVDGSAAARRISAQMSGSEDVESFALSPGGQRVAYRADQTNDGTYELVAAPLGVGSTPAVYVAVPGGPVIGDVIAFRASPDGKSVLYQADEVEDGNPSLFHVSARGLAERTPVPWAWYVDPDFAFSPNGEYAVYRNTNDSLTSARLTDDPWIAGIDSLVQEPFAVSADGARVVYRRGLAGSLALHSAPIDDSAPPVRLSTYTGFPTRSVTGFEVDPGSQRVVYRADQDADDVFELFSAPIDVTEGAVKLNTPLNAARDVATFAIGPDGTCVVYVADQDVSNQEELYVVPIDASAPPQRLNGTVVNSGDVTGFAFTPDGSRVVYRADQVANDRFELFAVDLLAPVPTAIPLTALAGTQDVQTDFQIGAGGTHVFYRADAGGALELFRVPVDGSASPAQLSAALVAGGAVTSFALAPDGQRVVYHADQDADERFELYSVAAGGGTVTALDPLPAFADVDVFRIASDSAHVVWRADRGVDGVLELYGAPLDASALAVRLNEPLPAGGNVEADFAALAAGHVVYRADQEEDERFELFHARLGPIGNGKVRLGPSGPLPSAPPRTR